MAKLPLKTMNFKDMHQYADNDMERVRAKLKQQVTDMFALIKQPKGSEWRYILDYFGEVPPSFWERHGKIIIDTLLVAITISFLALFIIFL